MLFLDQLAFCLCFVLLKNRAAVTFALESANVVGYQEFNLNEGYGMTTATFTPISGDSINLQDLIPAGEGVGGYGDVVIQTMDSTGSWAGEYAWYTMAATGMEDGWYDTEMSLANATINYKQGLFVQAGAGVKFVYSGAVAKGTVEAEVPNGYSMSGNATPVALSIQNIVPAGEGVGGYGDVVIQTMDSAGSWNGEYAWYTMAATGMDDGWYDTEMNLATKTIEAGEGIFLQASADGVKLQYPGAL